MLQLALVHIDLAAFANAIGHLLHVMSVAGAASGG